MPNWGDVFKEINKLSAQRQAEAGAATTLVRQKYLGELSAKTGRNVIAYYSGWLSKPGLLQTEINDEDKNGFMMAVHGLDRKLGLDLILHTPGGNIAATESIVDYLHRMFGNDIRAIVPQIAMSAGTMIACSTKRILLAKHSNLGPIDPHLNGAPAYGVIQEFKRASREVAKKPACAPVWHSIISQYRPAFLSQCENSIKWSNGFVRDQLKSVMFAGDPNAAKKARTIVRKLTDYGGNKSHTRHINFDDLVAMGLLIDAIETDPDLQDLILTVHHCYMYSLMNTPIFKMIENQKGAGFNKQVTQPQ